MDTLTILKGAAIIWALGLIYVVLAIVREWRALRARPGPSTEWSLTVLRERWRKVEPEPTSFNCCEGCVYHGETCFCPFEVHPIPVNNGRVYLCTGRESLRGLVHRQADEIIARVWA